jgi:Ser/Thr protein kinase RdoA (MazF antagonist)
VPLVYDAELGAVVTWLPFDPRLPALGETGAELARRFEVAEGEPVMVGYKPRGRAVMRLGPLVLKAYGRERQFQAALAGLETARHGPLATAAPAGAVPELRLTAQRALPGRPAADAVDVAARAGAMIAALQAAELAPALASPPERLLEAAERKAAVLEAVQPDLAGRPAALVGRLRAAMPVGLPLLPAHGDFHVDQLLVGDGDDPFVAGGHSAGIAVVDFDEMCVAPAALDLATYAADVVRGRPGDLDRVHAVLEPLLEGYGARPEALDWHLAAAVLGRAAHPFQRQVPHWRERAEATLAVAEACVG